jgi:hypothetical protein
MARFFLFLVFTINFVKQNYGQDSTNVAVELGDWRNAPSSDHSFNYSQTKVDLNANLNGLALQFDESLHFIGYENTFSSKFGKGIFMGVGVHDLVGNSLIIDFNKYKFNALRAGLRFGYKILILNRIVLEPAGIIEYASFQLKDITADSKLKNNSLNLGFTLGLKVIPYINITDEFAIYLGASIGYLAKVPNKEWFGSRNFDSHVSAQPFNWSGWNFGIKIGMIVPE